MNKWIKMGTEICTVASGLSGILGDSGIPKQLRLREDKGRKIRERKRKGRKRKKERWGVERAKRRERQGQQVHHTPSGRRIVSWEGDGQSPARSPDPCDLRVALHQDASGPHPVTLYHAQEHCLLCDLQSHSSSSIATPRQLLFQYSSKCRERNRETKADSTMNYESHRTGLILYSKAPSHPCFQLPSMRVGTIKPELT